MNMKIPVRPLASGRRGSGQNRRTLDMLTDLQLSDERIGRDAAILGKLRHTIYRGITTRGGSPASPRQPTLYSKYQKKGFPLRQANGNKIPRWRFLSPWLKVQIASLVLAERGFRAFKVHLHDDLRLDLEHRGIDQKDYLRDRIKRLLRDFYGSGNLPLFFFVMEDRDSNDGLTRPHAHGSIEMRRLELSRISNPKALRHLLRVESKLGVELAELQAGRWAVTQILKAAGGMAGGRPTLASTGLDQRRNVWTGKPRFAIFNPDWVTYAFKNVDEVSPTLGENRLAFPYDLMGEAKLLWSIIRGDAKD